MGCAPAGLDWWSLRRLRRTGRSAKREPHRVGRRAGIRRHRTGRPPAHSAFDRRRIYSSWILGFLSSPPWPLCPDAALVHPLLCRVRLDRWGILAGLVVVKLQSSIAAGPVRFDKPT